MVSVIVYEGCEWEAMEVGSVYIVFRGEMNDGSLEIIRRCPAHSFPRHRQLPGRRPSTGEGEAEVQSWGLRKAEFCMFFCEMRLDMALWRYMGPEPLQTSSVQARRCSCFGRSGASGGRSTIQHQQVPRQPFTTATPRNSSSTAYPSPRHLFLNIPHQNVQKQLRQRFCYLVISLPCLAINFVLTLCVSSTAPRKAVSSRSNMHSRR